MPESRPLIFICYRGDDAVWGPDLVYTALTAEFGEEAVFKAGFSLRPGDEFPPILRAMAASCPVMLVCIGPRWLTAQNPDGTRRLDDAHDWVRQEVELSLQNNNHVIPLLLGNHNEVSLPKPEDLPADIASMVECQRAQLEPGGRLRITIPDLIARIIELIPGLAKHLRNGGGGTINSRIRIGTLRGKAVGVRAPEGGSNQIDAEMEVDEVTETGEAMIVDLLQRDREPEC